MMLNYLKKKPKYVLNLGSAANDQCASSSSSSESQAKKQEELTRKPAKQIETKVLWRAERAKAIVKKVHRSAKEGEMAKQKLQPSTIAINVEPESSSSMPSLPADWRASSSYTFTTNKHQDESEGLDNPEDTCFNLVRGSRAKKRARSSLKAARCLDEFQQEDGVENVRANFLSLIHYNKLQSFYFGALIYSVINLLVLLQLVIHTNISLKQQTTDPLESSTASSFKLMQIDGTKDMKASAKIASELIKSPSVSHYRLQPFEQHSMKSNDNDSQLNNYATLQLADNSSQDSIFTSFQQADYFKNQIFKDRSMAFRMLLIILPSSLLLLLVIILTMIEFNSSKWHCSSQSMIKQRHLFTKKYGHLMQLEPIGFTLSMLLLIWPIYLQQLTQLRLIDWLIAYNNQNKHETHLAACLMPTTCALMVIFYSILALMQGTQLITRILCSLLAGSALFLQIYLLAIDCDYYLRYSQAKLMLFLLVLAFISGLLKRRQLVNTSSKTFSGSSELIEAKVSLEQQRQHQETLLLSVLPAYVAEQVKRNMLKKMTSIEIGNFPIQSDSQQAPLSSSLVSAPASEQLVTSNMASNQKSSCIINPLTVHCDGSTAAGNQQHHVGGNCEHEKLTKANKKEKNSFFSSLCSNSTAISYLNEAFNSASIRLNGRAAQLKEPQLATFYPTSNFIQPPSQARRGFNELYIRTYNNVSLLYGDIVGFTRLCTQLSSWQLVRVLNDLFSHFDHLAEQYKIMRIKILGDCYYGVSGIPEFAVMGAKRATGAHYYHPKAGSTGGDNHVINCVNMGLEMISYMKCLNVERQMCTSISCNSIVSNFSSVGTTTNIASCEGAHLKASTKDQQRTSLQALELNMRIGIHTGHIHSGVIGLKKWQFDIWSNDVSIAMHCESSGVPGRVHVTEATLKHLHGEFTYELAPKSQRNSYLADKEIRTYLVGQRIESHSEGNNNNNNIQHPAICLHNNLDWQQQRMDESKIRTATIGTIKQILLSGETASSNPGNAYALALDHSDLKALSLEFFDQHQEKMFETRSISRVAFLSGMCIILSLVLLVFQFMTLIDQDQSGHTETRILLAVCLIGLLLVTILSFKSKCKPIFLLWNKRAESLTASKRRSGQYSVHANGSSISSEHRKGVSTTVSGDSQKDANKLIIYLNRLIPDELVQKCRQSWLRMRYSKFELADRRLSSALVILIFCIVISSQALLSIKNLCPSLPIERKNVSLESGFDQYFEILFRQQITAILTNIGLNLFNCNLVSHKSKCLLISANSLIYFMILIMTLPKVYSTKDQSNCRIFWVLFMGDGGYNSSVESSQESIPRKEGAFKQSKLFLLLLWSSSSMVLVLSLWSLAYIRQIEYALRCNFLWRNRLSVDHEELEYISGINKVLLENILPSYVVQHYLRQPKDCTKINENDDQREQQKQQAHDQGQQSGASGRVNSLRHNKRIVRMSTSPMRSLISGQFASAGVYHEQHSCVAVMFASIPHFYEFYDESDISKQGLSCIALLNEIICDFDKLLLKNKFSRIEKIKTIGSTYMAAAGLRSFKTSSGAEVSGGSSSSADRNSLSSSICSMPVDRSSMMESQTIESPKLDRQQQTQTSQEKLNLICMIQFASSLMSTLNKINEQSFQVFKLRVGVNTGPVIAGIIGAQRPFYDIWGDCVNIASRMESLGEIGRIQVDERTAKLLMDCRLCTETYLFERRGPIAVKGKGGMVTYFVDKKQHQHQQVSASSTQNSNIRLQTQSNCEINYNFKLPANNSSRSTTSPRLSFDAQAD